MEGAIKAIQQLLGISQPPPQDEWRTLPNGSRVKGELSPIKINSPAIAGKAIQQEMQPQSADTFQKPDPKVVAETMRKGLRAYGNGKESPMEKWIPQMVEATQKYPIFAQHPYLLPAVSLNETSGYTNYTHLNNPLSWGARLKEKGIYIPSSVEQSIGDAVTAIGGDPNRGQGYDPETAKSRMQTASYYDKFRKSGKIEDFVQAFEANNPKYLSTLQQNLSLFQ